MNVGLAAVAEQDKQVLANLIQLYCYDWGCGGGFAVVVPAGGCGFAEAVSLEELRRRGRRRRCWAGRRALAQCAAKGFAPNLRIKRSTFAGTCPFGRYRRAARGRPSRARAVPVMPLRSCGYGEEQRSAVTGTAWQPLSPEVAGLQVCAPETPVSGTRRARKVDYVRVCAGQWLVA